MPELSTMPIPKRLHIVACGTSFNAGMWAQHLFESWARIPVSVEIASEFRYRDVILEEGDVVLVISQSGETADTLAALRIAKEQGIPVVGLCNVVGSSIARESDVTVYTQAGPEISVASTKAMCSQMAVLLLMGLAWRIAKTCLMLHCVVKCLTVSVCFLNFWKRNCRVFVKMQSVLPANTPRLAVSSSLVAV